MKFQFKDIYISTPEIHLPEKSISSDEIEALLAPLYKRLKLPHGRLELMTGIKERKYWDSGTLPSDIASKAALNLITKHNIDIQDIDQLVHASVCRNFLEPSTASVIHDQLQLKPECMIYDLSNACLGVMSSILSSAKLIESGLIENALIVSGENGGPLLFNTIETLNKSSTITRKNIKKYIANLTIGSSAVAVYVSGKKSLATPHKLIGGAGLCDTSAHNLCHGDGDPNSLMMETDSEALLKKGIELSKKSIELTLEALEWSRNDFDYVIGHQVGSAHEEQTFKAMGISDRKSISTYEYLGNTGSAALPTTLNYLDGQINPTENSKIGLLGIGSGLNTIMMGILW
jgi:acyl-CoA:acyl-CoA alkyltransferase